MHAGGSQPLNSLNYLALGPSPARYLLDYPFMWPRITIAAISAFLLKYGSGFFSRLWFLLRQLWHEVIGSVFAVLAFGGGSTMLREWNREGFGTRFLLAAAFTLMMLYFGFTSFRSARRVRQSSRS